ncbi:MAG: flippase [Chloroflexi bacterium]|nr:flippase [Chloroflexota bacterium]
MNHIKRIAKNSVFQTVAYGIQSLTAFFIPVYLARLANAELLGQYATTIALTGLFAAIAKFGLPSLLIREIARSREDPEKVDSLVNAAIGLTTVLSTIAIVLMLITSVLLNYPEVLFRACMLAGLALGVEAITYMLEASFRGREMMEWSAVVIAVMEGAFLLLALVTVPFQAAIDWLMVAYLASRIIALVAGIWIYQARFGKLRPTLDKKLWSALFKTSLPFAITNGLSTVYVRIDVVFLSYLASSSIVGLYEAANNLTMRLNIVARTVNIALYPFLASEFAKDEKSLQRYTGKTIRLLVILGTLIAVVLWAFSEQIVVFVYGSKFVDAIQAVKWMALIIPLRFIDTSLEVALSASNREAKRAKAVLVAALTNLLLNFILIPPYRMMGAVYATVLTEVVMCAMYVWILRTEAHEMLAWQGFIGPGLGAATILIASLLVNTVNIWLLGGMSVLLYCLIVVWMDRSSIEIFRQIAINR